MTGGRKDGGKEVMKGGREERRKEGRLSGMGRVVLIKKGRKEGRKEQKSEGRKDGRKVSKEGMAAVFGIRLRTVTNTAVTTDTRPHRYTL
jgi:hypothetical protein